MRYQTATGPLVDWIEDLGRYVSANEIDLVVIDSLGLALAGVVNESESVVKLFEGLRELDATTLLIDHQGKGEEANQRGAIGSSYKRHYARSEWEMRRAEEGDGFTIGLYHRKANNARRSPPIGLNIQIESDELGRAQTATFTRSDVQDDPELAKGLSPNPPKDTDGRREDSGRGWVRELQGRWPGVLGLMGGPADGLQSPHMAPKALCGSRDARDGERIRSRGLSRTGVARVWGDVGSVAGWPSGREWNGLQPGQGATELGFPRPAPGRCKVRRRAERVIRPTRAKTRRLRVLVITVRSPRPIRAVQRARLCAITWTASQAPLAAKRADGMWIQPDAVLEVAYGVLGSRPVKWCKSASSCCCCLGGCRLREIGLRKSFVEGQNGGCEVSTSDDPFVVLFGQDSPNQATRGWPIGEDAHDIGAAPYLLVETLQGVVGPDFLPVADWEAGEGQDVRTSLVQ